MNPKEVQIELAEKFELPCGHEKVQAWDIPEGVRQCPDCRGSGVRHPLQKPCPKCYGRGAPKPQYYCTPCNHRGWLYDDSPDVLTDAIREKGWIREERSDPFAEWGGEKEEGDYVELVDPYATPTHGVRVGQVTADEGLRGMAALDLAALRAVEVES